MWKIVREKTKPLCGLIKGNSAEVTEIFASPNVLGSKEDASFDLGIS